MSSTNRGAARITNDKYVTPAPAIDSLLDVLDIPRHDSFLEPCRGDGAILDRVECEIKWYTEIDEGKDYLTTQFGNFDLIITNPPFSLAIEFLEKSLSEAKSVFYLLRLNFLGSQRRKPFWDANPPSHVMVLSQRPCFVWICKDCKYPYKPEFTRTCHECGGKVRAQTDSIEYAWFGWDRGNICKLPKGVHVL